MGTPRPILEATEAWEKNSNFCCTLHQISIIEISSTI